MKLKRCPNCIVDPGYISIKSNGVKKKVSCPSCSLYFNNGTSSKRGFIPDVQHKFIPFSHEGFSNSVSGVDGDL